MSQSQIDITLFGRETSFRYSTYWLGYALIALRLVMGYSLFSAGLRHLSAGQAFVGQTRGLMIGATQNPANPFGFLFEPLVQFAGILAPINAWALLLCGLGVMLGAFMRLSALGGGMLMLTYWLALYPPENSIFLNDRFVYMLLFFGLGAAGAGRILGVDEYLENLSIVKNNPWLKYLLG